MNSGPGLRRLAVGYRTGDHTGSSVPVTAEGLAAFLFTDYMDDLFFKMAAALLRGETGGDLASLLGMQTKEQVLQAWGRPKSLADFGPDFQSSMYEMGPAPDEEFTPAGVITGCECAWSAGIVY